MTRQEAIKVLSILKAAFPNSYKGITKEEANGVVNIWAVQFTNIPFPVVSIAINKLISTATFPPTVGEVKEKIRSLYWEAKQELPYSEGGIVANNDKQLPPEHIFLLKEIIRVTEPMRTMQTIEPTLADLIQGYGGFIEREEKNLLNGN